MLRKCGEILEEEEEIEYPKPEELENISEVEKYIQYDDRWFLNSIFRAKNPKVKTIASMIKKQKTLFGSLFACHI